MELSELINKLFNGASVESACIHEHDGRDKLLKTFARFAFRFLRFPQFFFLIENQKQTLKRALPCAGELKRPYNEFRNRFFNFFELKTN